MIIDNPSKVTGLFIVNLFWFIAFVFNEFRQFHLARKNGVRYWTTKISGNIVDLVSYMFLLIAFIIQIAFFTIHEVNDPQRMNYFVIYPHLNNDHLEQFCPFSLPKLLVIAQANFSIRNFSFSVIKCDISLTSVRAIKNPYS